MQGSSGKIESAYLWDWWTPREPELKRTCAQSNPFNEKNVGKDLGEGELHKSYLCT